MKNIVLLLALTFITFSNAQDVSFTNVPVSGSGGSGFVNLGVADLNGDFLDDAFIPSSSNIAIYYQTETGFDSQTISASSSNPPDWSVSVGDYDANGINDFMYGGTNGVSFLKANDDGSSYTQDVQSDIFIFSQRTNFVDINNDGFLDAFVCHDKNPNVYFLNDGNGSFQDEIQGGLGDTATGNNYSSIWFDYDGDGDSDLYISKCVIGSTNTQDPNRRNQLHRNNGDGTYTEVANAAGLDTNTQSWSSAVGDFDNDGDMDLVIADQHFNEIGTRFMINNGDGTFSDITAGSVFENLDGAIDIVTFDFNNDGYLDIYSEFSTRLLLNNGDMTFSANNQQINGGDAVGDLNNDGFLDVFSQGAIRLNDGNDNNWLKLNLVGSESNINGIGAIITIEGDFGIQVRNVRSGEGFRNMHSLNPHFGLGESTNIDVLTIEWPSGVVDTVTDVSINQTVVVNEGESVLSLEEALADTIGLLLFPNPAQDLLNISSTDNVFFKEVTVVDITGRVTKVELVDNTIDIQELAGGIYFLRLETENNQTVSRKFIKN